MKKIFFIIALAGAIAEVSAAADKTSAEKSNEAQLKITKAVTRAIQSGYTGGTRQGLEAALNEIVKLAPDLSDPDDIANIKPDLRTLGLRVLLSKLEPLKKAGLLTD